MSTISWFEIPTSDIERSQKFYETIFDISMITMDNPQIKMRIFPVDDMIKSTSGAIVYNEEFYKPSLQDGCLIYLNANPDVQQVLDRVESAGGKIMMGKTQISEEFGFMAIIFDTEGNRVGLHSMA